LERTWTASDNCGNSTVHTQIITVLDTTGPEVVGDFVSEINTACFEIPAVPELEFVDACSAVLDVTFTEESSQQPDFEDYQITRTWIATDSCGNSATYTQIINVSNDNNVDALDSRECNTDGPIDLFSYLNGDYEGTGVWSVVQGDAALLEGSIFNPESITEDTQYIFNYREVGGACAVNTNLAILIEDCAVLSCGADDVEISKAVTANGDAYNEFFTVGGIEECGFVIEVEIFNRWGSRVYKSNDYQNDWNGSFSSSGIGGSDTVPTGTYYYVINLRNSGLEPFAGPVYVATNK
jgi:gliding motility-associated-like protein